MSLQVVILAGGLATRLNKITLTKPKSLIEINGEPFISHQLRYLKSQGIHKVHLCLGHLADQEIETIKDNKNYNLNITYSFDGDSQLGTGGALKNALSFCDESFFVQYGDSYLPIKYSDIINYFLKNNSQKNILTIYKNNGQFDKSNVDYVENRKFIYNKSNPSSNMSYIDYGLSIFIKKDLENTIFSHIFDLSDIIVELINKKMMIPLEVNERFYEIGKVEGIKELNNYLLNK